MYLLDKILLFFENHEILIEILLHIYRTITEIKVNIDDKLDIIDLIDKKERRLHF